MNLIQIALAAEEFFREQPALRLFQARCVRAKNNHATCDRCAEVCPTGAIYLEQGLPQLVTEQCIRCGACLHICPVGALEREDGLYKLLRCVEALADREIVEVVCAHHPTPALAGRDVDAVIQIGNCLSELGPAAYIGLMALGVHQLRVRLDACAQCPLRVLQPPIEHSVTTARGVLRAFGCAESVELLPDAGTNWRQRPLYQSQNPPVSRRGFFARFAPESTSAARTIVPADDSQPEGKTVPRERKRLLVALRLWAAGAPPLEPDSRIEAGGFVSLAVTDACTACGVCERVCPTGAIRVNKDTQRFQMVFAPAQCTDCGLCVSYCEPKALRGVGSPLAAAVLSDAEQSLLEGPLRSCSRCKARFAGPGGETLCPVCRHRRDHPAGMHLPEALFAQLPEATRAHLSQYVTPEESLPATKTPPATQ